MHRFYVPDVESSLSLPDEEAKHCVRVLRLAVGDAIEIVDGKGGLFDCRISNIDSKRCNVEIIDKKIIAPHWGCRITLAIAPTKNIDRIEWLVEKVTEMGIDRIVPLLCRYSERKVLKTDRLNKILISAMKQSLKATLPHLDELTPIGDFLNSSLSGQKFIAYCGEEFDKRSFAQEYEKGSDVVIMIGPEGDFSKEEVDSAVKTGFLPVTLGKSRLRTETAGLFACAAVHTINQR